MGQSLNSVKINTKKQNCNTEQERMSDNVSSMLLLFDYSDLQKEQNTEFFFFLYEWHDGTVLLMVSQLHRPQVSLT